MKKIIIPIFHGHLARNILRTDVFKILADNRELEIVIYAPDYKQEYYTKEFGADRVLVERVPTIYFSKIDKFFRYFYFYFVDTATTKIIQQEQFLFKKRYFKYVTTRLLTLIFGHLVILRKLVRFFDRALVGNNKDLDLLLNKHSPDLVFIPSITSDQDTMLLRCANKKNILTVGMVRSWDNITVNKGNVRIFPDKFIVHTKFLKEDLIKYADACAEMIEVVGMSHFDYYTNGARQPREEFMKTLGADPHKRYIYFMPIGLSDGEQDRKIIEYLADIISRHHELMDYQLLVTSHPNTDKALEITRPNVVMIPPRGIVSFTNSRLVDREITTEAMELMADLIYHCALVVNYQGTSTIDAAAFDRPIINIAFDDKPRPYLNSVRRFYDFTHYLPIIRSGGIKIAHDLSELETMIVEYVKNPSLDQKGRARIVEEQCYRLDGRASKRTVQALLSTLINL